MAEPDHESAFGFLAHKAGPLPVWMWGLIFVGGWYWYTHYGPGATSSTTTGTTQTTVTESNTPYYTGSQYKTTAEWEAAAINYLVGESVPPDQASAAIWNYLHSKALNTQEQKDVNLAIEGIGPPPKIPAPAAVTKPKPHQHPIGRKPPPANPVRQKVTVPNVRNESYQHASQTLRAHHLHGHKVRPNINFVTGTTPTAGARVRRGTTVQLRGKHRQVHHPRKHKVAA